MEKLKKLLEGRDHINDAIERAVESLFRVGETVRIRRGRGVMVATYVGTCRGRWSDELRVRSRTGKIHHVHVEDVL